MKENQRIIIEYYGEDELYNHYHDPLHFLFNDEKHHYMFFFMVEGYGESIFDDDEDDYVDF